MAKPGDGAGVHLPPPILYAAALLLGLAGEQVVPLNSFGLEWRMMVAPAGLLIGAGATIIVVAAGLFRRLGTTVRPSRPTTHIAMTGIYGWTRNPMYLGYALIYAGFAIGLDAPLALSFLPLVLVVIQTQVIAREERYLEATFGDDYRRYKARVHRWLPPLASIASGKAAE